jgi:hypothetical protein
MARTAALFGMLTSLAPLAPLACATTVQPGLANVPATAIRPATDPGVQDLVANGRDSCERRLGPGPLRYQVPPCPGAERSAADPAVANQAPSANGIVMPWVEHDYAPWPCASWEGGAKRTKLARLASPYVGSDLALSGLTCVWPL